MAKHQRTRGAAGIVGGRQDRAPGRDLLLQATDFGVDSLQQREPGFGARQCGDPGRHRRTAPISSSNRVFACCDELRRSLIGLLKPNQIRGLLVEIDARFRIAFTHGAVEQQCLRIEPGTERAGSRTDPRDEPAVALYQTQRSAFQSTRGLQPREQNGIAIVTRRSGVLLDVEYVPAGYRGRR